MQQERTVACVGIANQSRAEVNPDLQAESIILRPSIAALPYLLITAATLLAWLPAIKSYIGVNDDYLDFILLKNGWAGWFQLWGIWRIWGIPLSIWSVHLHPLATILLGLAAHILAVCTFYKVCELWFGRTTLSLVLALLMGVFPWGYEAIVWAAAQSPVLAHPLFWANIIVLIKYAGREQRQQLTAFILSFLLTLVGVLGNDYLIFSGMLSGVIVWLPKDKLSWPEIKSRMRAYYSGWAPLLASLCYLVMYRQWSERAVNDYKHPFFNFRSLLSTYYYQYTNAWVFQPWFNPVTRRLTFFTWSWPQLIAGLLLALITGWLLWLFFRRPMLNDSRRFQVNNYLLPYIMLLLFGGSLVYAISGGYSLDSRKKYSLIPLVLLLVGWTWRKLVQSRARWTKGKPVILIALLLVGVTTTWLIIGIWRYEVTKHGALIEFLSSRGISGDIRLVSEPDLYAEWPKLSDTIGFRLHEVWVINNAMDYKGTAHINVTDEPTATALRFDPSQTRWEQLPR